MIKFDSIFKRRICHEPISKIFNNKEFWSYDFYVNKDVLDPKVLKKEKEIIVEELKNSGKDNKIVDKIAAGKLNKFISDNTLLNQEWIMEPKKKVKDVIRHIAMKEKLIVKKFIRFKVGEGA